MTRTESKKEIKGRIVGGCSDRQIFGAQAFIRQNFLGQTVKNDMPGVKNNRSVRQI